MVTLHFCRLDAKETVYWTIQVWKVIKYWGDRPRSKKILGGPRPLGIDTYMQRRPTQTINFLTYSISTRALTNILWTFQHSNEYSTIQFNDCLKLTKEVKQTANSMNIDYIYLRQRRTYVFARTPAFICLSICLCARLLKNACMDLDEMLRVDGCRDMDELINFWTWSES